MAIRPDHRPEPRADASRQVPAAAPLALPPLQAAKALGIHRSTLYRLIKAGTVRTVTLGRRRLIPMSSLRAVLGEPS